MSLTFIEVIDLTTKKDEDRNRVVTFSYPYFSSDCGGAELCVLGSLSHATRFTFDKANAQQLIDFLQERILND